MSISSLAVTSSVMEAETGIGIQYISPAKYRQAQEPRAKSQEPRTKSH
jgi:hypothetical protein